MTVPELVKPNDNRKPKPADVTIIPPLSIMAAPNTMGRLELTIIGLGDDSKIYQWLGKEETWYLFNN